MSDKQFTFFELHFHDGIQLGPRSLGDNDLPSLDGTVEQTSDPELEPPSDDSDSGSSVLRPLFGLGLLVAGAYAVRKLLQGDPEGLDALDDIEMEAADTAEDLQAEAEESVPIDITTPEEEEDDGGITLVAAAVVGLLVLLALAARKVQNASEEITIEE